MSKPADGGACAQDCGGAGADADAIRIWTYNFLGLAYTVSPDRGRNRKPAASYREALERDLRWIAGNALHNLSATLTWTNAPRAREALALSPLLRDLNVGMWSTMSPFLDEAQALYFLGDYKRRWSRPQGG